MSVGVSRSAAVAAAAIPSGKTVSYFASGLNVRALRARTPPLPIKGAILTDDTRLMQSRKLFRALVNPRADQPDLFRRERLYAGLVWHRRHP